MKELETENQRLRKAIADLTLDKLILQEAARGNFDPARRRACVEHIRSVLNVSERRACRALGQHRSTQRKTPRGKEDEEALTADLIALARQYGRYGYRKIVFAPEHEQDWLAVQAIRRRPVRRARGHGPIEKPDLLQRPDRAAHTSLEPWLFRPVVAKLADKGMAGHAQAQWMECPRDGDARGQRSCRVRPSVSEAAGQEDRSGGNQPRRTHTRAGRWRGSGRGAADR